MNLLWTLLLGAGIIIYIWCWLDLLGKTRLK